MYRKILSLPSSSLRDPLLIRPKFLTIGFVQDKKTRYLTQERRLPVVPYNQIARVVVTRLARRWRGAIFLAKEGVH